MYCEHSCGDGVCHPGHLTRTCRHGLWLHTSMVWRGHSTGAQAKAHYIDRRWKAREEWDIFRDQIIKDTVILYLYDPRSRSLPKNPAGRGQQRVPLPPTSRPANNKTQAPFFHGEGDLQIKRRMEVPRASPYLTFQNLYNFTLEHMMFQFTVKDIIGDFHWSV